jgi:hypothetical protein
VTALQIVGLINAATATAQALTPVIQQIAAGMSSEDAAQVQSALAELQTANDVLHASTQSKLRG